MDYKRKIALYSLTCGMAVNIVSTNSIKVMAETNDELNPLTMEKQTNNSKYIYLSDLDYISNMSNTSWGSIKKDTNLDGRTITLNFEGEILEFEKGIAAHATSNVVYDVSAYSNDYSRFTTYVGVDRGQGGNGNGVKFSILTSQDGSEWEKRLETEPLKGNSNSVFVDIDISNVKYIKLHAHDNGSNGNDHAVYGAPRIMKPDYDISTEYIVQLKTVQEYDEIIKNTYSINDSIVGNYEKLLLQRTFIKRVGFNTIQAVAKMDEKYAKAINWLVNDEKALKLYVTGGEVESAGNYRNSLKAIGDIYDAHKEDFNDFANGEVYLKMAISTAISHAKDIRLWTGNAKISNPRDRYEIYKELYTNGNMALGGNTELFKNLPIELMRWVMDNKIDDEEINWLVDNALDRKNKGQNYLDAYTYIEYTSGFDYDKEQYYDQARYDDWNKKYNIDSLSGYGTKEIHKLWMVFEEGSVCGGLANTYANLSQVFGMPAAVVGQPGHAATLTYSQNEQGKGIWSIKNDISGWIESEKGERLPLGWGSKDWDSYYNVSYILLAQKALDDYDNLVKSQYYNYLADVYKGDVKKQIEIYNKSLDIQNYNLDSLVGLIDSYKSAGNKTSKDFLNLANKVADGLAFFPLPFADVMKLIEPNITDDTDRVIFDMLRTKVLKRATEATEADTLQYGACISMARYLLGENSVDTATFSFDGENAGKIMINDIYDNSSIRWEYSLDGWKTKKETDSKEVTLTKEELEKINPENDIQISLVGTSEIYTIDITKFETPSNLYLNDLENQFRGFEGILEYSDDDGKTWYKYNPENTRFTGDKKVIVRYLASGTKMQSDQVEYNFTEDNQPENRKYIKLKNIRLHEYSSQENNTNSAAINMIDGNINTMWHNTWSGEEDKYYSVEFDKPRYIASIEYKPSGGNGTLKNAKIYTSMDGVEWTESGAVNNLANNVDLKILNLDKPTLAKYVKIEAINTYGYPNDVFFTGKMFNFFEDSTYKDTSVNTLPTINVQLRHEIYIGDTFDPLSIATATDKEDGDINLTDKNVIINKVNTNKAGEYAVKYEVIDSDGGRRTKTITVVVKTVTNKKPVISFPEDTVIKTGSTFNPLEGVTAKDYKGQNITLTTSNVAWNKVNTNEEGEYQVKYTVTDSAGNTKIVYRTVKVEGESIVTQPVISKKPIISFPETTIIKTGSNFEPLDGVTAKDYNGKNIKLTKVNVLRNEVDTTEEGTYQVKYRVEDSEGNYKIVYRTVKVEGQNVVKPPATSKKPVITFSQITELQVGDTFDPLAGVTATDYKGEDIKLTESHVSWNKVNTSKPGLYQVKYTVTDTEGNTKIVYRDVIVKGFTGLKGDASINAVIMDTNKNQITVRGEVNTLTSIVNGTESNVTTIDNKVKYHLVAKDSNGQEVFTNYMVRVDNGGSYSSFKTNLSLSQLEKIQDSVTLSLVVETLNISGELELGVTALNIVGEVQDATNNVKYTSTVENGKLKITKSKITKTSIEKETMVDTKLENEVKEAEAIEENKTDVDLNIDNSVENNEANKVEETVVEEVPVESKTESLGVEAEISNSEKEIKGTIEKVKVDTDKNLIKFEGLLEVSDIYSEGKNYLVAKNKEGKELFKVEKDIELDSDGKKFNANLTFEELEKITEEKEATLSLVVEKEGKSVEIELKADKLDNFDKVVDLTNKFEYTLIVEDETIKITRFT